MTFLGGLLVVIAYGARDLTIEWFVFWLRVIEGGAKWLSRKMA